MWKKFLLGMKLGVVLNMVNSGIFCVCYIINDIGQVLTCVVFSLRTAMKTDWSSSICSSDCVMCFIMGNLVLQSSASAKMSKSTQDVVCLFSVAPLNTWKASRKAGGSGNIVVLLMLTFVARQQLCACFEVKLKQDRKRKWHSFKHICCYYKCY